MQPAITPHLNNKNFDRKNISRETEAEQIKIINSQLMKDKKAISSREDTKKINSIQLNNHTEITTSERKNDNSLNSLVFKNNKATNEEEEEEEETESSISSSCSSDSSICTTTNNTEEIINKNINNIKQDQSFIDYSSIMRQSVDIESYNSKLPLSSSSSSSSYWNYDELNDLRIKFISLLSSDLTSEKSGNQEEFTQFNKSAVYIILNFCLIHTDLGFAPIYLSR